MNRTPSSSSDSGDEAKVAPATAPRPKLSVVSAKDYVPGRENEVLEGVQALLVSSMNLLERNVSRAVKNHQARRTRAKWPWVTSSSGLQEEKKSETDGVGLSNVTGGVASSSGDWTPGEMDGIMDSMSYVLDVMSTYQTRAHKAASEIMVVDKEELRRGRSLAEKVDKATSGKEDDKGMIWNLQEAARDMSSTDFMFGSLMPSQSMDEYPEGSEPIFPGLTTSLGPTTDMFLGSLSSMLGMKPGQKTLDNGNLLMDSKLRYLEDVHSVSSVCATQVQELNTILSNRSLAVIYELPESSSMLSASNSVVTRDVEDQAHPHLNTAAATYIQAARDRLSEYTCMARKLLRDEVRCAVSEYTCAPKGSTLNSCAPKGPSSEYSCTPKDTTLSDNRDGPYYKKIQRHFSSDAYNMSFKAYLTAESDNEMQMMLLNTLHSSLFLRNVRDKCQQPIRLHVGQELSVSICNSIMASILNSKKDHRITEWGALIFGRHVRALHAYVYEFCRSTKGTEDILARVEVSSLDAPPMDANWQRLFSAINMLKLERLDGYDDAMLHPLFTLDDARRILRLRKEFDDEAIIERVRSRLTKEEESSSKTS